MATAEYIMIDGVAYSKFHPKALRRAGFDMDHKICAGGGVESRHADREDEKRLVRADSRSSDRPARASLSAEDKLNKTERSYLVALRGMEQFTELRSIRIQAITLKLAFDCRLTPDFSYQNLAGQTVFVDVKGFQREDALIKMKVAAAMFPEYRFVIVKKDGDGWKHEWVSPV